MCHILHVQLLRQNGTVCNSFPWQVERIGYGDGTSFECTILCLSRDRTLVGIINNKPQRRRRRSHGSSAL